MTAPGADGPRVVVVVPWRPGDRDRERAWRWCKEWWAQFGWLIHVVEHPPPRPFNRSWCINEGARRADAAGGFDVLVAIDADVFEADAQQVRDGVARCWETGKLIVPHIIGADLNTGGTKALTQGQGNWERFVAAQRDPCTSRVTIIRADVFAQVGGFDQRFQGWGHEDVAFWAATVPINGVEQMPGTCWHLWHAPSLRMARGTTQWRDGAKLAERYLSAFRNGWPALERILDERREDERYRPNQPKDIAESSASGAVDVFVLTAGRKAYLERTMASFAERVTGDIGRRTIQDDSGDPDFNAWLLKMYPDWELVTTPGKIGFTEAIRNIWAHELAVNGAGAPYVFHLEEDFVFDQDIDLADLIRVLEFDQSLAQVALLRGPWAPPEIKAGGIIQQHPPSYQQQDADGVPYLKHRRYFTTNPCLYRRSIMEFGWPNLQSSEVAMTKKLRAKGMRFAYLGDGTPMVTHIGDERVGIGY